MECFQLNRLEHFARKVDVSGLELAAARAEKTFEERIVCFENVHVATMVTRRCLTFSQND